jgi:hypothetical protein
LVRSVVGTDNHGRLGATSGGPPFLQFERLGTKAISVSCFVLSAIVLGELREE